jgi:hypothetical protein
MTVAACGGETSSDDSASAPASTTETDRSIWDGNDETFSDEAGVPDDSGGGYADPEPDESAVEQGEWEAQEGDAWESFNEGYLTGWEEGCDVAFEGSPDGSLYDQGDEYTADDCYGLAPYDASLVVDVPLEVPDDPYFEGEQVGMTDGCVAAYDELPTYGVLNYGEESFDASVCP